MFLNWKRSSLYWHARVQYHSRLEASGTRNYLDARVEEGVLSLHAHAETGARLGLPSALPTIYPGDHASVKTYDNSLQAMTAFEVMVDSMAIEHFINEVQL